MTLRTVTYDDATHVIVPIEPTDTMMDDCYVAVGNEFATNLECKEIYSAMISAAPEYQSQCCAGGPQWGHAFDCKTLP